MLSKKIGGKERAQAFHDLTPVSIGPGQKKTSVCH